MTTTTMLALAQMYALKQQLDATIMLLEVELKAQEKAVSGPPTCPHPNAKLRDATTLGGDSMVLCLACGDEFPGVLDTP